VVQALGGRFGSTLIGTIPENGRENRFSEIHIISSFWAGFISSGPIGQFSARRMWDPGELRRFASFSRCP
jgi:hypothetical protein